MGVSKRSGIEVKTVTLYQENWMLLVHVKKTHSYKHTYMHAHARVRAHTHTHIAEFFTCCLTKESPCVEGFKDWEKKNLKQQNKSNFVSD
jgi:hypothetical protein